MARLVDVVAGPPRPGPLSDSDSDDDYDMWYGQDLVGEPDGECIGCGVVGVAGGGVFRVGLRWSPGMARSTTTSGGLMVLVRMSRSEG